MLRKAILVIAAASLLSGCSPDPKATKITPELLEDPAKIQKVANRLEPADRELFGRYVLGRTISAKTGLGPLRQTPKARTRRPSPRRSRS